MNSLYSLLVKKYAWLHQKCHFRMINYNLMAQCCQVSVKSGIYSSQWNQPSPTRFFPLFSWLWPKQNAILCALIGHIVMSHNLVISLQLNYNDKSLPTCQLADFLICIIFLQLCARELDVIFLSVWLWLSVCICSGN